jgi:hypothetical protein
MGVLNKDIWHREVLNVTLRNNVQPRRWGMFVTVTDDSTSSNNTTWVLVKGLSDNDRNNNSNWQTIADWLTSLGVGATSALSNQAYSANGVLTQFVVSTSGATIYLVEVGGQIMRPTTDYSVSGTTITFTTAPANGTTVVAYFFTTASYSPSSFWLRTGTTTVSAATIAGNISWTGRQTRTYTETRDSEVRPVIDSYLFTVNPASAPTVTVDYHGFDIGMTITNNTNSDVRLYPFELTTEFAGTGTLGRMVNLFTNSRNTSTGIVQDITQIRQRIRNEGGGTIGNVYHTKVDAPVNSGTITNLYGHYIEAITAATNNWGYYSLTANNYVENLSVGVTSRTAALHLKAGSATANTAPLKFTSGTLLTTPENGAMEFDGTHVYITAGGTRYQLDNQAGVASWQLNGTSTIGSSVSIDSNAASQLHWAGTWTASANNQYHSLYQPTITARATITDTLYAMQIRPSLTAGATGQTLVAVEIRPTFVPGAFTPSSTAFRVADASGNVYFSAINDQRINIGGGSAASSTTVTIDRGAGAVNNDIINLRASGSSLWRISATGAVTHTGTYTLTAGSIIAHAISGAFSPSSGSGNFTAFSIANTINQTGASGTIIIADINPTLTSVSGTGYGLLIRPTTLNNGIGIATPTALLDISGSTTARASLRIRSGTAPSSPNDGDIWFDGTNLSIRISGVTRTFNVT